ncbi:MAG TPA: calcium-binding protein, partial [Baekduia sp.]|nr:calcium-binding protein [Baekduia sp.]
DLKLPLGSDTVVLGAAVANSTASATCAGTTPQLNGSSQLTGLTLGGTPVTLDELITRLTEALRPLGPIVEIVPNEQVRDATSLTQRALHVKVFRDAGEAPLLDVVVAESRVVAPPGVCTRPAGSGTAGDTDSSIRPCPPGSTLEPQRGVCIIRGEGPNGRDIIIGLPYQGPSGGRVDSLRDARQRYPNDPCVRGEGLGYVIIGTNGNDRITGTNGSDRILLLGGNDRASSGRGDDCISGGSGRDVMTGGLGDDRIYGSTGRDSMNGSSGNDRLSGGSDHDTINGGYGADRAFGGSGADFINVATAGRKARVSCGTGRDKVRYNYDERATVQRDCEVRYEFRDRPRS